MPKANHGAETTRIVTTLAVATIAALALVAWPTPAMALPEMTDSVLQSGAPGFTIGDIVGSIGRNIGYLVVTCCASIGKAICGISGWLILSVSPDRLLASSFDGTVAGEDVWGSFYTIARRVSDTIALPFGTAFLTIFFILAVIRLTDTRRMHGYAMFESFMRLCVMYAIAATLVMHAVDVMGGIYWVGLQLYGAVSGALQQVTGTESLMGQIANTVAGAMDTPFDGVTYETVWVAPLLVVLSLVVVFSTGKMVIDVFSLAILRMAEIYVRCAFAAIPLSLVVNDETRRSMWQYVKRFLAACCMGAVLLVALLFAGGVFSVIQQLVDTSGLADTGPLGVVQAFGTLIPPLVAVFSMDVIVRKASDVSNSLFGLS